MQDNGDGRKWARGTLVGALFASMVGNIAHTWLADSAISLALRVPAAVIWPLATFFAIEVLVRMVWQARAAHRLARFMLAMPAMPAAVVSYQHLHSLLLMMGEIPFISWIGPAAVDGLMIGCTMALLFTRALPQEEAEPLPISAPATVQQEEQQLAAILPEPVFVTRLPRGEVKPALKAAVVALLAGEEPMEGEGASRAVIARYRKVMRQLRDNPHAVIDSAREKVRPELVDEMRAAMRMEAVR